MDKNTSKSRMSGIKASRRAASDFLRAGRRQELKRNGEESGWELFSRFDKMSDEDFDKGVADGSITKDQIRKAGQEAYENYMLDVWSEQDDNDLKEWPSYEEFYENPEQYGYTGVKDDPEFPDRLYRYKPGRYDDKFPASAPAPTPSRPDVPSEGTAPSDNTAVAKKPVPQK